MRINVAHLRDQGIDFAVFDADTSSRTKSDRDALLSDLVTAAQANGLHVEKAALAFRQHGRLTFHGTQDLVRYLAANPLAIRWTHTLDI